MKKQLLDNLLRPHHPKAFLERERERDFRDIYSATSKRCREQSGKSHAYMNWFKLRQHLEVVRKRLHENHPQSLSKSRKPQ